MLGLADLVSGLSRGMFRVASIFVVVVVCNAEPILSMMGGWDH